MDLLGNLANLKVDTVLSAVDKYVPGAQNKIKNLADKAKAYVNNVSELELKVLEATNHDPWGPHGSVMQEITNNSFHSEGFYQIMGIVDQRLQESPENWRLVYKALLLLEYMVKHGPMSVSEALLSYSRLAHLEKLRDRFEFKEASGRDQGVNVRQRAGALVSLVQDSKQLAEERDKAAKNKAKYTGVSSSSMRYGGFGAGGSSGSSDSYSTSRDYAPSSDSFGSSSMGTGAGGGGYGSSSSSMGAGGYGSSYRRSGSGSGAGVASDSTAAGAAGGADPVEATRQRIARLKAEGALPAGAAGAGADGDSPGGGPGFDADGLSPKSNKPKKLSEIKINPAISATFAKGGGLAPPPGASKGGSSSTGAAAAASGIDLLGDLDVSPAPPPAAAAAAAPTAGGGLDEWDGFAGAPGTAAAAAAAGGADEWAAFDSAPPAGSSKPKQQVDINSLLGPLPTATAAAASSGPSSKGPLALDDFCDMPAPAFAAAAPAAAAPVPAAAAAFAAPPAQQQQQQPAAAAGFDPFSGAPAVPAGAGASSGSSDPFAASGSVHMMSQAPKQHAAAAANGSPKLGPETAKAKDPFADLAFI